MRGGAGTPVFARFENVRALRRMLENAWRNGMTDAVAAVERRITLTPPASKVPQPLPG